MLRRNFLSGFGASVLGFFGIKPNEPKELMIFHMGEKFFIVDNQIVRQESYCATSWYKNGQLHREGGPAIEFNNGDKYWYKNGQLHREDGPAVVYHGSCYGYEEWYENGKSKGISNVC